MPRKQINYENTCFYKIVCKDLTIKDLYVGHTTDFRKRKNRHKFSTITPHDNVYNSPVYQFIRNNGGWDNFDMILIERCQCIDGLDAKRKERELIERLGATLNKSIPSRVKSEYWQEYGSKEEYKEKRKEYMKTYRNSHHTELHTSYNCICGGKYQSSSKAAHLKCSKHTNYLEQQKAINYN